MKTLARNFGRIVFDGITKRYNICVKTHNNDSNGITVATFIIKSHAETAMRIIGDNVLDGTKAEKIEQLKRLIRMS